MRKGHLTDHFGWIFVDLIHPDETRLHLQLYLQLSRSGVKAASFGHLDLNSTSHKPMPSGELGQGTFASEQDTEIVYNLNADLADVPNVEKDGTNVNFMDLVGKSVEASTFVGAPFSIIPIIIGSVRRSLRS